MTRLHPQEGVWTEKAKTTPKDQGHEPTNDAPFKQRPATDQTRVSIGTHFVKIVSWVHRF